MVISVKNKIFMTVLSVVLMFALFILFYFPARQEKALLENYNQEIENFAKSIALGVEIGLTESNMAGIEKAMGFVRNDERLEYVSIIQFDEVTTKNGDQKIERSVLTRIPENVEVDTDAESNEQHIVKRAGFETNVFSGEVLLSFSTDEIAASKQQIRLASLFASLIVFILGMVIGYLLARNISKPVLALRDAANKVGEGDLTQFVKNNSKDEVGQLGTAFNRMVKDLSVKAALERVRNEIAGMRSKEDLPRISPIIWKELISLGVSFERCGIFIIHDPEQKVECYLSTPDGRSLGVFDLGYDTHEILGNTVEHWRNRKNYDAHWNRDQFLGWMQLLIDLGHIENSADYQRNLGKVESLNLHFVPFAQGMLYVGNHSPLSSDELLSVRSLAEAFSFAYTRYEEFKRLEDAKLRTETTLAELKLTQSQLIHSEKMASLGELTAGIAHEIQNPLNFVNNFAEVSVELIGDLDEEMANGKEEDVHAIKEDLKQNLIKINHHGQRASSIVKGMLEHSRTPDGQKVPTDINALADEYLRLAYHGLRAKDKSFNADFEIDAEKDLPIILIQSQDVGRVFLNLINNAFYAVNKRSKKGIDGYRPQVRIATHKLNKAIEVRIRDNGDGIPAEILDKIFQPFFTTKPTGEGTGLGLSLSYDIITKAHRGNLKVDTEVGVGTEFIVTLPE